MLGKVGLRSKKYIYIFLTLRPRIDGSILPMMYDVNHEEHKVSMIREKATDSARQFFVLIRRKSKARMALYWAPYFLYGVHRSYSVIVSRG